MKVIDLLNKIANEEEVPKKIIVEGIKYSIVNEGYPHTYKDINGYEIEDNFSKYIIDSLNDEIEVIEEEKDIEELKVEQDGSTYYIKNEYGAKCYLTKHSKIITDKVNELIEEVNKLKNK